MEDDSRQGHRSRILERFEKGGLLALHDYEILEVLLGFVILRKDTKPAAKALLKRFGSMTAVLNAAPADIRDIEGIGHRASQLIAFVREMMAHCLRERYDRKPVIAHRKDVERYLAFHFAHRRDEFVAALFLDNGNHVVSTDIVAEGTVNQCVVYPRTVIGRALTMGAASFLLAHNHPGGGVTPSEPDWAITHRLFQIGKLLEMPLLDHLIISRDKVVSLKDLSRWPGP